MLDDLRKRRDDEKNQKKKANRSVSNNRTAGGPGATKTTLGFAGATMMGFGTNPAAYQTGFQSVGFGNTSYGNANNTSYASAFGLEETRD